MSLLSPSNKNVIWLVTNSAVNCSLDPEPALRTGKRSSPYHMTHLAYDPLTAPKVLRDSDGTRYSNADDLLPRLAESWQASNDFQTWTIRLRENVRSSFGNTLNAADVKWSWDRAFAVKGVGLWRSRRMAGVESPESVHVLDDRTIQFTLAGPNPEFPQYFIFATNNVVDSTEVRKHADANDPWATEWLADNVAGFGAFNLESRDESQITYRARADYWAGKPGIDAVQLRGVDTREEAFALIERGEANFLAGVMPDEAARFENRPEFQVHWVQANHSTLEFNWLETPFDDMLVRQAVACALPLARIREAIYGGHAWASVGPVNPKCRNAFDGSALFASDIDRARSLLRQSAHASGFETTLFIRPNRESRQFAEIARDALKVIGIIAEIREDTPETTRETAPMWFKDECGHALTETMYDLGHDYDPPRGLWPGRFFRNEDWVSEMKAIRRTPAAGQPGRYADLQRSIVTFTPCVFVAELEAACVVRGPIDPWAFGPNSTALSSTVWTGDRQILPAAS